ncbi:MAG: TIGR03936 family radical SAM-associated protein [Oscillospiraceae bacterium]|nr:TIGR03936 family radical SAM-associated protein [Oscillospiraceae bacterium]
MSRLLFTKEGSAVWSSHLDLMRALMRSFRRAGIELKHSQGFTPHPELSILMPLSVGVESQCEIAEFTLAEGCAVPVETIAARMNPVLPAGLRALESWDGGLKAGRLAWLRARLTLTYEATGNRQQATGETTDRIVGAAIGRQPEAEAFDESPVTSHQSPGDEGTDSSASLRSPQNDRIETLGALFARPSLVVEKHGKKGVVETDIAPMIRELTVKATGNRQQAAEDAIVIEAVVAAQNPTLNPLLLATAIETYLPEYRPDHVLCRRIEIYDADMNVFR